MNAKNFTAAFLAGAALLTAATANAASSTTTFQVTANVSSSCSVTASDVAFGAYDPLSALPTTATGGVTVTCTLLTPYQVGLSAGNGSGATVTGRKMTSGGNTLNYALYRDVTRLSNWGNTLGTDTVSFTGTGLAVNHAVYGTIPAQQAVANGNYTDTITVTLTY